MAHIAALFQHWAQCFIGNNGCSPLDICATSYRINSNRICSWHRLEPHEHTHNSQHPRRHIGPGVGVAPQLESVAQHEELAYGRPGEHHEDQHNPVLRVAVGEAVVVAQHGKQHGQGEVGVVHAALLAAPAVDGVHRLTGLDAGHHLALSRNDPVRHIGRHGGRNHRPHQQKGRASRKPVAGQVRGHAHQHGHQRAHHGITMLAPPQQAAHQVIRQPEHHQKSQGNHHGHRRAPVHQRFVDEIGACVPQIGHREQRKTGEPSAVTLPVKPMQLRGQLGRRTRKLDRVVETTAVHCPQLAAHALALEVFVLWRGKAAVQKDEVERRAYPGNGGDHVRPAQQQVGPV